MRMGDGHIQYVYCYKNLDVDISIYLDVVGYPISNTLPPFPRGKSPKLLHYPHSPPRDHRPRPRPRRCHLPLYAHP